jgi:acyl carrier protein
MTVTIEDICSLVGLQLGFRDVSANARFIEDMGAESVDLVNLIAAAEDKFHISFDEEKIARVRTVHELYELIKKTGRL